MSLMESFKPYPVIATMTPGSDTVKWSDSISAPLIIPLTVILVIISIIILCIIKCIKTTYDKKLRCDTYEISDLVKKYPPDLVLPELDAIDGSLEIPDHPNLNLIKYSGEKKRLGHTYHDHDIEAGTSSGDNSPPSRSSNGGRVQIEVHDSSNENNDNLTEEEDDDINTTVTNEPQIDNYDSSPYSHHNLSHRQMTNHQFVADQDIPPENLPFYTNHHRSPNGSGTLSDTRAQSPQSTNPLKHAPLASTESEV